MSAASRPPTSVQVMDGTGFTDSPSAMLPPPPSGAVTLMDLETRQDERFHRPIIRTVRRAFLAVLTVCVCAAAVYGYTAARRERTFRLLIDHGDAALAKDDTFA